jgi:TonB-linked SusC/RagA family outer membrane protein
MKRLLSFFVLSFFVCTTLQAQTEKIKLKNAVDAWQKKFSVSIVYSSALENETVNSSSENFSTIENQLNFSIRNTTLNYEKVKDGFYVITSRKKSGVKSFPVTGIVQDQKTKSPISGVSVTVKSTGKGTSTDKQGKYLIGLNDASEEALIFTYSGFKILEVDVKSNPIINVSLEDSVSDLKEVVITALGFEAQKDKLGYATSKISGAQVANSGEVNLTDALGGKASGVRISRSSGTDPGSASQIIIRGQSTITRDSDPLIVLDGVPIISDSRGESSQGVTKQSRLNDINPDDIASIQVLKGASAAALWGTRAANGVIVITTKKGSNNNKVNINFKTSYSIDEVYMKYQLQDIYGQGTTGLWKANNARSWGDKIADRVGGDDIFNSTADYFIGNQTGKTYYPILTKNSKETFVDKNYDNVFGKGHALNNSLSISGSDGRSNYFFSLSDTKQDGIIKNNSDYRRNTVRINASRQMNKWLKISNKASYVLTNSNRVRRGSSSGGVMLGLLRTPADFDNTDYSGSYFNAAGASVVNKQRAYRNYMASANSPGFNNPLWTIYKQDNNSKVNRFTNSAELNITPVKWFDMIVRAGLDQFTERELNYLPLYTINAASGSYSRDEYEESQLNLDVIARAQKKFSSKFEGNLLFGFNYNNQNQSLLSATGTNFIIPDGPRDLDNSPVLNIINTDRFEKTRTNAVYATIGTGIFDQIYLNATGRLEAASTFGTLSNSRFFYPSADLAWQFSDLKGFPKTKYVSFGKLRASFGIVGIQPAAYNTATNFFVPNWGEFLDPNLDGSLFGLGTYVQSRSKGNPYLRPEKKKEIEIGTDIRMFNNNLTIGATYYSNKTIDALLNIPQAASTGYNTLYANAGSIQNTGLELDLSYKLVKKRKWNVELDWNFSKNNNKVLDLYGASSIDLGGLNGISSRAVVGQPLGALWGIGFQKGDKSEYVLESKGFPISEVEQKVLGNPNPDWRSGFGFTVEYKKFKLYSLFEHSQGGDIVDATESVLLDYGMSKATANEVTATTNMLNYAGATIPAGTKFRGNIGNFGGSDVALDETWYTALGGYFGNVLEPFVKDATWTRLREVNISYRLNEKSFKNLLGINYIDLEISGRNLWVLSKLKNIDPDSNLEGSKSARGIVYFNNPGSRSYLFTLKLNF